MYNDLSLINLSHRIYKGLQPLYPNALAETQV